MLINWSTLIRKRRLKENDLPEENCLDRKLKKLTSTGKTK